MTTTAAERRERFRELQRAGTWVIPNPFDVGSAVLLQHLGFAALATTSSGFAATLGRRDQRTMQAELGRIDDVAECPRAAPWPGRPTAGLLAAAEALRSTGTSTYLDRALPPDQRDAALS